MAVWVECEGDENLEEWFAEGRVGNLSNATCARELLCSVDGAELRFAAPHFNEFAVRVPGGDAEAVADEAARCGVVAGVPLGRFDPAYRDTLLVAVTETHGAEDIRRLAKCFKGAA